MFNSILHDNVLRHFIVLLMHLTDKTPVVDKRDITGNVGEKGLI